MVSNDDGLSSADIYNVTVYENCVEFPTALLSNRNERKPVLILSILQSKPVILYFKLYSNYYLYGDYLLWLFMPVISNSLFRTL